MFFIGEVLFGTKSYPGRLILAPTRLWCDYMRQRTHAYRFVILQISYMDFPNKYAITSLLKIVNVYFLMQRIQDQFDQWWFS